MSDPRQSPDLPEIAAQPVVPTLRDAIRRVRIVHTDQADGLADLRDTERARLELLADDLADLIAEVPDDLDVFAFALSNGETPRLWIDMTAHVALGRDRRTYRLLKDTRVGRTVLHETADRAEIAARIADYVAERILDRQRAIEGDWIALKRRGEMGATPAVDREVVDAATPPKPANEDHPGSARSAPFGVSDGREAAARGSGGAKWIALFLGLLLGAGGLAGVLIAMGRL
jgi:hypothetical protein